MLMQQSLQARTTMSFAGIKDKESLNGLRAKFDDCIHSHVQCRMDTKLQSTIKDMKVIDCIRRTVIPAPPDCRYFALSYVWGENQQPCALDGILPQTIEDSITATMYLGHHYLWIDRFCIDQGGSHKHQQLQQMGAIYATAEMTLIAAAGDDPAYGLPGISRNIFLEGSGLCFNRAKWLSRGWTLQEDILSRRRLVFCDDGLRFFCYLSVTSFSNILCGRTLLSEPFRLQEHVPLGKHHFLAQSEKILSEYVGRQLTFDKDALNAIVGMFNMFHDRDVSWNHIWGVPYAAGEDVQNPSVYISIDWPGTPGKRRSGYPSWSPLGWKWRCKLYLPISSVLISADDFQVGLWNGYHYDDIKILVFGRVNVHTSTDESKCLRLTAYSFVINNAVWSAYDDRPPPPTHGTPQPLDDVAFEPKSVWESTAYYHEQATLQLTSDIFVSIEVRYDLEPACPSMRASLLAVFVGRTRGRGFVLQRHGDRYERAGNFYVNDMWRDSHPQVHWDEDKDIFASVFTCKSSRIKKRTILWG